MYVQTCIYTHIHNTLGILIHVYIYNYTVCKMCILNSVVSSFQQKSKFNAEAQLCDEHRALTVHC